MGQQFGQDEARIAPLCWTGLWRAELKQEEEPVWARSHVWSLEAYRPLECYGSPPCGLHLPVVSRSAGPMYTSVAGECGFLYVGIQFQDRN